MPCPTSPPWVCQTKKALRPIRKYLQNRAKRVRKDLRRLTLSGSLPATLQSVNEITPGHKLKEPWGLFALRPEILNIELTSASWGVIMLSGFDSTRLKSLRVPVSAPGDCLRIGAALKGMPHLAHLTITELSDGQEFVKEFRHLGDGILALWSSLRSLDIDIASLDPGRSWRRSQAFLEPQDVGFFFREFFPEPSYSQVEALIRARYDDPREPPDVHLLRSPRCQLNLERLRLRHIGLPWWAFQTVFSPHTIKDLDLPKCRAAENVWDDLGKHAKIHKLANTSYAMLTGSFMNFLSTQNSLRFLSFARPPDVYNAVRVWSYVQGFGHQTSFVSLRLTEAAPHLGLGTAWGKAHARKVWLLQSRKSWIQHEHLIRSSESWSYFKDLIRSLNSYDQYEYPKKSDFMKALSNMTLLKHLVIPADMFDITPKFMACLAIELPALEYIEWAFDYACPVSRLPFNFCKAVPLTSHRNSAHAS